MEINDSGERRWAGRGEDRRWMDMGTLTSHLRSLDMLEDFVVTHTLKWHRESVLKCRAVLCFTSDLILESLFLILK